MTYLGLFPLDRLAAEVPDWPYSAWSTRWLIRIVQLAWKCLVVLVKKGLR